MHLRMAHHPLDPSLVRMPTAGEWAAAEEFAARHAATWWDLNPVFASRAEAETYAFLAPVETEIATVEYELDMAEEDGWFDSFRAPHWFRVIDNPAQRSDSSSPPGETSG